MAVSRQSSANASSQPFSASAAAASAAIAFHWKNGFVVEKIQVKHDLGADGFCLKQFFATEAAFRAILLLFNLLVEFQRAADLPRYREPATIRTQVLTCGAILGRAGRRLVLHLSQSWGGLKARDSLLDSILRWQIPTSPKLDPLVAT